MEYTVRSLKNKEEIEACELFHIDQYNWGGDYRPKTYGRMGYLDKDGFYLNLICEEANPTRTYYESNDPVYLDSAMEAFLCFGTKECDGVEKPYYLNFEMNGNGAMLASMGCERTNRVNLPEKIRSQILCTPQIHEDSWELSLYIPVKAIAPLYAGCHDLSHPAKPCDPDTLSLQAGSTFTCNFFKLKESEGETQHFASFSPIDYPEPNFHLPACFAHCTIR
ncbi:MAG: carbohydrate-binding family 9-like protein [Lachnospiraceae bacterium]|nr:carbohydrate-binding family 9-like protein [Lachnospiraceae bacterium]